MPQTTSLASNPAHDNDAAGATAVAAANSVMAESLNPDPFRILESAVNLFYAGELIPAKHLAESALSVRPCPEALGIIAAVHGACGNHRQEILAYRDGLGRYPSDPVLAINFARCLRQLPGRGHEALIVLREALRHAPTSAALHFCLIETLRLCGDLDGAEKEARRYTGCFPADANGHLSLSLICLNRGDLGYALQAAESAMRLGGDVLRALEVQAHAYALLGSASETLACYREMLNLGCDSNIHSRLLMAMQYCDNVDEAQIFAETMRWSEAHASGFAVPDFRSQIVFDPDRNLTVGILSRDFRRCSTLYLARPVLENLPAAWHVTFYDNAEYKDADSAIFDSLCDCRVEIGHLSDQQVVDLIGDRKTDVLIDLNGHTLGGRPGVFARKAAPVQLAWLDYVGTTGLRTFDGLIADVGHIPEQDRPRYTEPLRYVGDNLYRFMPPADAPEVAAPPMVRNGYPTFGCFNSAYKITPTTISLWARILRKLSAARLLLNAQEFAHRDTQERFRGLFSMHGIPGDRIIFLPGAATPTKMLETYGDVDIALDPTPYSGGLTTLEALYMGVPVVTMTGRRFGGRHSSVHLKCVALSDWVVATQDAYVETAVHKASDVAGLEALRAGLRTRLQRSAVMNGAALAAEITAIVHECWKDACCQQAGRGT